MKERLARFMYGRYGEDNLNRFLSILALILCIISLLTRWTVLSTLAIALLVFTMFRMFSRNTGRRQQENLAYLRAKGKITGFFSRIKKRLHDRKTHRYYKCPSCRQEVRVPKGKGRIRIHCPKCQTSFERVT